MDSPFTGRIVVLLTPVIAAASLAIVNWVQDLIGVDLDGTQLAVLLTGALITVVAPLYKWLDNRGKYEQAMQQVEMTGGPSFNDPQPPDDTYQAPPGAEVK